MISKEEVERIAELARLSIDEDKKEIYAEQLSAVLDYMESLKKISTLSVDPMLHVSGVFNVLRDDGITSKPQVQEILKNTPMSQDGYIKVKAVLEK